MTLSNPHLWFGRTASAKWCPYILASWKTWCLHTSHEYLKCRFEDCLQSWWSGSEESLTSHPFWRQSLFSFAPPFLLEASSRVGLFNFQGLQIGFGARPILANYPSRGAISRAQALLSRAWLAWKTERSMEPWCKDASFYRWLIWWEDPTSHKYFSSAEGLLDQPPPDKRKCSNAFCQDYLHTLRWDSWELIPVFLKTFLIIIAEES